MADTDEDGAEAELLERILTTERAEAFREYVRDLLAPRPGESVLSIGCGPGFEPAALARDVGESGGVHGVDANPAVLAAARERCADLPQVSVARGDATALPVPDDHFDAAVAKQVYQFVPDLESALAELRRVLAPDGRAVVAAGDLDARVLNTSDPELTRRVQAVHRDVRPHPNLGTRLASELPAAGLRVADVEARAALRTEIDDQVERGIEVHRELAADHGDLDASEVDAWERDLRTLDDDGEFLACGTKLCYVVEVAT